MATITLPEFNIAKVWKDSYIKLMKEARPNLGAKVSSYGLPVLPLQTADYKQIQFVDMVLRANDNDAIMLRLRRDNLYLVGFQMVKSGKWWEFSLEARGTPQLIPGSSFLGFTNGYDAMTTAGGGGIKNASVGRKSLIEAVIKLNADTTNTATRAKYLIVVIMMICESLRCTYITNFLAETFINENSSNTTPAERMVVFMKNWQKLSERLLKSQQDPTNLFKYDDLPKVMGINSYLDAIAVLGILKEITYTSTALRTTIVNDEQYPLGEPMVEVIWVKINNVCDLYGTIQVIDGTGSQYLYETTGDKSVRTKPAGELVLLKSPDRSILAYDSFTINVDLKAGNSDNTNTSSPKDGVVINGQISWNAFNTISNVYDQPLQEVIKGEYGSVTVNYVVLSDAVSAKLEVTLIKGHDDADTAHVYGDLTVRIANFEEGSVLFKKASKEPISVNPGQLIPLLKSGVSVPLNSSIIVQADILSHNEIAKGTAEFPALLSGTSEKFISGKYGEIRVKVTWNKEK